MNTESQLVIGEKKIANRLFLGTGKFSSNDQMRSCIKEAGIQVVTVAMRRVDVDSGPQNILDYIPEDTILMINTSGARNAAEAVTIAEIARESLAINWVKIEVIDDSKYLMPDNYQTLKATQILVDKGFTVLPYMHPDLYIAREMEKAGAAAIMPLGSFIGSGKGLQAREFIKMMIAEIKTPIVVDAGIGNPTHALEAMEMGADAVLVNTAVATAEHPVLIARAFSMAVEAGRIAYLGKVREPGSIAEASSPLTDFLFEKNPDDKI